MKKLLFVLLFAVCALSVFAYELKTATDVDGRTYQFTPGDPFGIHIYTLKNGMRVYLAQNASEPRVKIYTAVHAGSVNDPENSTGLAHYLEHMLFKGTGKIASLDWEKERPLLEQVEQLFEQYRAEKDSAKRAKIYAEIDRLSNIAATYSNDEYWQICREMGAKGLNAFTSYEVTAFVCDIPAAFLPRFLTVETERFSNPVLRRFHTELETVYEEFNRSQDQDGDVAFQMLLRTLYPKSPLGRDVIGLPEHLKNPSMKDVYAFYRKYYVPENMALIISGDIGDEAKLMKRIEDTYGTLPRGKQPAPNPLDFTKDAPLTKDARLEVTGPEDESVIIAYRYPRSPEADYMANVLDNIFDNGQTGILDTDLRMNQKIQSVSVSFWHNSQDYLFFIEGTPLLGQSLEEVEKLLLEQVEKAKRGEFKQENISAITNQYKLDLMTSTEIYSSAAEESLRQFRANETSDKMLSDLDKAGKITVAELAEYARKNLTHKVTLFKRKGPAVGRVHTVKPPITPVKISTETSAYAKEIAKIPPENISKVQVPDFKGVIKNVPLNGKSTLSYVQNKQNGRFTLTLLFPFGSYDSKFADLAFSYVTFFGTTEKTLNELNQEMYVRALDISFSCGTKESAITVSGLDEMLPFAVEMLKNRILKAKTDEKAFAQLVQRVRQERKNQVTRTDDLSKGAMYYSLYGADSPWRNEIPMAELEKIKPDSLTEFIRSLLQYGHSYEYYGPTAPEKVAELLNGVEQFAGTKKMPTDKNFIIQPPKEDVVYMISVPESSQISVKLTRTDEIRVPADTAFSFLFSSYAGQFFFTELREKRSLGYYASGWHSVPSITPENYSTWSIAVGTQSDKVFIAMDTILALANKIPMDESLFQAGKANCLTRLMNTRLQPDDFCSTYRFLTRMKRPLDINAQNFKTISAISFADFAKQVQEHTQRGKNIWVLTGNFPKDFNFEPFKKYGKIVVLSADDVFVK